MLTFFYNQASAQEFLIKYDSAVLLMDRGQLAKASGVFREVIDSLYLGGYSLQYFEGQYYMAVCQVLLEKKFETAEAELTTNLSKAIEWKGPESLETAQIYFGLGWFYDKNEEKGLSEDNYLKALNIYLNGLPSKHKKLVKTKTNYAQVLVQNKKFGRARKYLLEVIDVYPEIYPAGHGEYTRLYTLAFLYYQAVSEKTKSLEYALTSLELSEKNYGKYNFRTITLVRNVAIAYSEIGEFERAIDYGKMELEIIEKLIGDAPHIRKAEVLNNMGQAYRKIDYTQSVKYTSTALDIKIDLLGVEHPSTISTMLNLASEFISNNELERGKSYLLQAWDILENDPQHGESPNWHAALGFSVDLYARMFQKDTVISITNTALQVFQSNITLSSLTGRMHHDMIAILENITLLFLKLSASNEELLELEKKIHWMDSVNQETLLKLNLQSDQLIFFKYYTKFNNVAIDLYYELYMRLGDMKFLNKIILFSEKNKATILSPEYAIARLKDQLNVPMEVLEKERMLLTKITEEKSSIEGKSVLDSQLRYDSLRYYLKERYPDYFSLRHDLDPPDIEEIQSQIPYNTQILTYALTQEYLYIIVIDQSQTEVFTRPLDSLQHLSEKFINGIVALEDMEKLGQKLYSKLIPANISKDASLVISTQDYLALLPFEMLQDGEEYLGISNPLSYTPSVDMWLKNLKYKKYPSSALLAIAPDFSDASAGENREVYRDVLVPIPGAQEELEVVMSQYDGTSLSGDDATKVNFINEVSEYGMIHLATHALIDNSDPNLSRLYFTKTEDNERSYIYNYELYNLDLNANLVTLSACNTGIGQIQDGDGANSLARGFMYAGVPAVVVSLWPVSDKSTPQLMKYFYQNLARGQHKDVALNNARKEYLSQAKGKARHPFYWGGFVLIGDNAPIKTTNRDRNLWVILISMVLVVSVYLIRRRS